MTVSLISLPCMSVPAYGADAVRMASPRAYGGGHSRMVVEKKLSQQGSDGVITEPDWQHATLKHDAYSNGLDASSGAVGANSSSEIGESIPVEGNGTTCVPSVSEPTVRITTPPDQIGFGHQLEIEGKGWCHPGKGMGASEIAVWIDGGQTTRVAGSAGHGSLAYWAVIDKQDINQTTGDWKSSITLPDGTSSTSTPALTEGEHSLLFLSGTLKPGDTLRSPEVGFRLGGYRPTSFPQAVSGKTGMTNDLQKDMSITRSGDQLTLTIPHAQASRGDVNGHWVYLRAYKGNGDLIYPPLWDQWFRADKDGIINVSLVGVDLPVGAFRVLAQAGVEGDGFGSVLGWAETHGRDKLQENPVKKSAESDSHGTQLNPDTGSFNSETVKKNTTQQRNHELQQGKRGVSSSSANTQAKKIRSQPTSVPQLPVKRASELTLKNNGGVSVTKKGSLFTITNSHTRSEDWVFAYLYPEGADPIPVGWTLVDTRQQVKVDLTGLENGQHKIAFLGIDGKLLGWADTPIVSQHSNEQQSNAGANGSPHTALPETRSPVDSQTSCKPTPFLSEQDLWLLGGGVVAVILVVGAALVARKNSNG